MEHVKNGLYVSVAYTGTLQSGEVFDTSKGRQPLEVHMGAGRMIPGFESELMGMGLNEKKTFTLDAEKAYGLRDETLLREFPRSSVPDGLDLEVGGVLALQTPQGEQIPAQITKIDEQNVTLDLNHPLAGEALTFEVEIVGISPTQTQVQAGCSCGCDGGCSSDCG